MNADLSAAIERARAGTPAGAADSPKGHAGERLELQRVAQQFEAMLLTQMLREMRKAGELTGGGDEEDQGIGLGMGDETFTETIDSELALYLAKNKGIGLTSQLMQAFDRMNAGRSAAASEAPTIPDAAVTSGFGWRSDPFTGEARFHKGIDLRAAYGETVQAAAPGTVVFSGDQGSYGTTVVIEHADGTRSRYAHLSAATVAAGQAVQAGEAVGRAGRSGRATGTHLHFEVTGADGQPVSPAEWMQRWAESIQA